MAFLWTTCAVAGSTVAATSIYELEPNDAPADALAFRGAATVYGSMPGNDQDGYLWTVSDTDALKRWTFELRGQPDALTKLEIVRLEYTEAGTAVAAADRLFSMATRDVRRPALAPDLLFEPGEYLIGISHAGTGRATGGAGPGAALSAAARAATAADPADDTEAATPDAGPDPDVGENYQLIIREGKRFAARQGAKPALDPAAARKLANGRPYSVFETEAHAWYQLEFDPADGGQRYDVSVQVPVGRTAIVTLHDAAGERLTEGRTDASGRVRFVDLAPTGPMGLQIRPLDGDFLHIAEAIAVGPRGDGSEAEPNDQWARATRVRLDAPATGRLAQRGDDDYLSFAIDEALAAGTLAITVTPEPANERYRVCLLDAEGESVQCRQQTGTIVLPDLTLAAGDWGLRISQSQAEVGYTVALAVQGPADPNREAEPNDRFEHPSVMSAKRRARGRFSGEEDDYYRLQVTEAPQLWRVQAMGDGIEELALYNAGNTRTINRRVRGERRVRLDNLFLLPGTHTIKVAGQDGGEYTLIARPLGPPSPDMEREPNDTAATMQRLAIGQTRQGLLPYKDDVDLYRFFLAHYDHIELQIQPPADGVINPVLYWSGQQIASPRPTGPGEAITITGVFPPGDYRLQLSPTQETSEAEYSVSLTRRPRFECPVDCEPNGYSRLYGIAPVPPGGVLIGTAGDTGDKDEYLLPTVASATRLKIVSAEPVRSIELATAAGRTERLTYDETAAAYLAELPAGAGHRLILDTRGQAYELALSVDDSPFPPAAPPLDIDLELQLDHDAVSAYRSVGQRVAGNLTIRNHGSTPATLELEATTSDHRWTAELGSAGLDVPAGAALDVPVEVTAPADAWADQPVQISVRAAAAGAQVSAWQDIAVRRELPLGEPAWAWPVPEAVRGGINMAFGALGGRWHESSADASKPETLFDGVAYDNNGHLSCCHEHRGWQERPTITVELAGDEPVPVAGIALNFLLRGQGLSYLRRGTLLLSMDGETFQEVLTLEGLPIRTEQYFALPAPVAARYARLRLEETFHPISGHGAFTLNEWKVIAAPGHDPTGGRGFNLADPTLGGHVVREAPVFPLFLSGMLEADSEERGYRVANQGDPVEFVIGFHDDRAARISGVDWLYSEGFDTDSRFDPVAVHVATESPLGPWQSIGTIAAADGAGRLVLDTPVWARFVKISSRRGPDDGVLSLPRVVRVWEQPSGEGYRSVLGEWGDGSSRSYFELQQGLPAPEPPLRSTHGTKASAESLSAGTRKAGRVALGTHEHWYRIDVPNGQNLLTLRLDGTPTVRTQPDLEQADGRSVALEKLPLESTVTEHVFEAAVTPGEAVFLRVYEPPRNIVFSWDTSASVNQYLPTIYNALAAFASQVIAGRESVNLVPFGRGPLLDRWQNEPYVLQTILNDYPQPESSSAAESTLRTAASVLAPRAGSKAIVVVTDARTNHDGKVWEAFGASRPSVFGIHVGGIEASNRDLFQDWAGIGGGHYDYLKYDGEMEIAFDRATTMLRRPAGYGVTVTGTYREAPGPGSLRVVGGADGQSATGPAVAMILDASGSMLQRLQGKRRIQVAREVLTGAVANVIPAGTPLSLRVFGHKQANACRTDLEVPLGPLDPDRVAEQILGIEAMNLARTPIAASLQAVPDDLGTAADGALVILVTDGEETCEGDPEAVIRALRERDLDIKINIVGFAIDEQTLEDQFTTWARLGGGRYFSANDQTALQTAIEDALRLPFTVYDPGGSAIASGFVGGEPIAVPAGTYRVEVAGQDYVDVEIAGGQASTLQLDAGGG